MAVRELLVADPAWRRGDCCPKRGRCLGGFPQNKTALQAIKAAGLRELISSIKEQPEWVLVVRGEQTGDCEYTTWRANLRSGALERFGEAETTCLLEFGLSLPDKARSGPQRFRPRHERRRRILPCM